MSEPNSRRIPYPIWFAVAAVWIVVLWVVLAVWIPYDSLASFDNKAVMIAVPIITIYISIITAQSVRKRMIDPDKGLGSMTARTRILAIINITCMVMSVLVMSIIYTKFMLMANAEYIEGVSDFPMSPSLLARTLKPYLYVAAIAQAVWLMSFVASFSLINECLRHPIKTFKKST